MPCKAKEKSAFTAEGFSVNFILKVNDEVGVPVASSQGVGVN